MLCFPYSNLDSSHFGFSQQQRRSVRTHTHTKVYGLPHGWETPPIRTALHTQPGEEREREKQKIPLSIINAVIVLYSTERSPPRGIPLATLRCLPISNWKDAAAAVESDLL